VALRNSRWKFFIIVSSTPVAGAELFDSTFKVNANNEDGKVVLQAQAGNEVEMIGVESTNNYLHLRGYNPGSGDLVGGIVNEGSGYWFDSNLGVGKPPDGQGAQSGFYGLFKWPNSHHPAWDRSDQNSGDYSVFLDGWNIQNTSASHTAKFGEAHICTNAITITLPARLQSSGASTATRCTSRTTARA
jgi:hypothetical protein